MQQKFALRLGTQNGSIILDNTLPTTDDMEWINDLDFSTFQLHQLFGPPSPVSNNPLSRWEWKLQIVLANGKGKDPIKSFLTIYDWAEFKCPHCDYSSERLKIFKNHLMKKHHDASLIPPVFQDFNEIIWCVSSDSDFKSHRSKSFLLLHKLLQSKLGKGHHYESDSELDSSDSDSDSSDSDSDSDSD